MSGQPKMDMWVPQKTTAPVDGARKCAYLVIDFGRRRCFGALSVAMHFLADAMCTARVHYCGALRAVEWWHFGECHYRCEQEVTTYKKKTIEYKFEFWNATWHTTFSGVLEVMRAEELLHRYGNRAEDGRRMQHAYMYVLYLKWS